MATPKASSNKNTVIIVCVIIGAFVLLTGAVIFLLVSRKKSQDVAQSTDGTAEKVNVAQERGFVDESNAATILEDFGEKVEKGMFECEMSMDWTFQDGTSPSRDAYVRNSEKNNYTIYFDVYGEDPEDLWYSSPLIPVGEELRNIQLAKDLEAGSYEATVRYTLVDQDNDYEEISSAGFVIQIRVLN